MTTPTTIKIEISTKDPVRLTAAPGDTEQLLLKHDGSLPSNVVEVRYPDRTMLPVTLEIADTEQWRVSATHGSHAWTRGQDCCKFEWSEPVDNLRVDVEATRDGVSRSGPIFIKVQPQGVRPDL